jgi:hypothetical protein
MLVTFPFSSLCKSFTHRNESTQDNQHIYSLFEAPISRTRFGIQHFFKKTFNDPMYNQYLALNFSHISTFLSYSNEADEPRAYIKSVIRLFSQKIKSCSYINGEAFLLFLKELPRLISKHFEQNNEKVQAKIQDCLYNFFLDKFDELKEDPEHTLEKLTQDIYSISCTTDNQDLDTTELQCSMHNFLDLCLNRLIWSPQDQDDIWKSVKNISHALEELVNAHIIKDVETLDELFWSLIHRFCYFLEIAGLELEEDTIKSIGSDLQSKSLPLWSMDEQESFITPKRTYLKNAVFETYATSSARKAGLIVDTVGK